METKAGQIISTSSIIGTIIFGFSAIILSTSTVSDIVNKIDVHVRYTFFIIIIVSMITVIFSVFFGLNALKIQKYQYIIGSGTLSNRYLKKEKIINKYEKLKVRNELSKVMLKDFLKSIISPDIRDNLSNAFTQLVKDYFEEDKDSSDRDSSFKEFSVASVI